MKKELIGMLPPNEAPLVLLGKALHNVIDGDQPDLKRFKKQWANMNTKMNPPLE
jgi:hypothetical protein